PPRVRYVTSRVCGHGSVLVNAWALACACGRWLCVMLLCGMGLVMASDGLGRLRVGVVGASGYTGAELRRLLQGHSRVRLAWVAGASSAGQRLDQVLPSQIGVSQLVVETFEPARHLSGVDAVFLALPHGAGTAAARACRQAGLPVFDLSADLRLRDVAVH